MGSEMCIRDSFWVARKMGVRVLTFSVGFGHTLWQRQAADGTVYRVAAFPLGGYVKMLDEREGHVEPEERDEAFNNKSVGARIAIVAAGPAFNLVFAVLAFWLMFLVGTQSYRLMVGEATGLAADAGLERGDVIVAVDGKDARSLNYVALELVAHALDRNPVSVTAENAGGITSEHQLDLSRLGSDFSEEKMFEAIGIEPWSPPVMEPIVGTVSEDSPAERAGMLGGDRITHIGGEEVSYWQAIGPLVQSHGQEGQPLAVTVDRDGVTLDLEVTPLAQKSGWFSSNLILGIAARELSSEVRAEWERNFTWIRLDPLEAVPAAFRESWRVASSTLGMLGRMITGVASVKNLSGPISIAQVANIQAARGLSQFLWFLGVISLSLGILNLLPIPVLDGGHLVYYLIELVKGSPVSEQAQVAGQYFGLIALAGLMSLAIVNDILRLVG